MAVDGGWGWMVLLGAIIINVLVVGHVKSFGVYWTSLLHEFQASPFRIAWLHSIEIAVFHFCGPMASVLSKAVGPRKVALFGGFLAFGGLTASAYSPNLELLYLTFAAMQGVALTMTFIPGISIIADYFHKRRGFANGISIAGNAIGGMVMPLVVDKLIEEYTVRGCFLIVGSILLNSCVGAMLWRPVEWHHKNKSFKESTLDISAEEKLLTKPTEKHFLDSSAIKINVSERNTKMCASGPDLSSKDCGFLNDFTSLPRGSSSPNIAAVYDEPSFVATVNGVYPPDQFKFSSLRASSFQHLSSYSFGPAPGLMLTKEHFICDSNANKNYLQKDKRWKKVDLSSIFEKSRFYIMSVSLFFHVLGYPGTLIFLPYRANKLRFSQARIASLLSVLAFCDFLGRISCGWISDFNFCPRKYWYITGMFLSGVFASILPLCHSYVSLLIVTAGFGFCCGAYIGLIVVLFADTYSSEKVAMAYSISTFLGGFMALGGPPLMGYILEKTGSYWICQITLGLAQFSGAAVWILEPWTLRLERKIQQAKHMHKEQQLI